MKSIILLLFLSYLAPNVALASDCPNLIGKIDAILAEKPDLDEETLVDEELKMNVRELRNEGEALHEAGKHDESVNTLQKALTLLEKES